MHSLQSYSWPGNVRELDNILQRALIMQNSGIITGNDLQIETLDSQAVIETDVEELSMPEPLAGDLKVHERHMILDALELSAGSRKTAAEKLGISPRTLRYKLARMREAGIAIPSA